MAKAAGFCNKGDYVWIQPDSSKGFIIPYAGKIKEKRAGQIRVTKDDGKDEDITMSQLLSIIGPDDTPPVDDMVSLTDLEEHTVLRNIQLRYYKGSIYTYIGWILIGVNPYKPLPIYTEKEMMQYESRRLGELPPHIYAIGAQAVNNLKTNNNNQCILISGETGAGKTESTKLLLKFLASVSCKDSSISNKIILSNPILEAFGNAKTTENDNSSRFGKYIELYYSDGNVCGARIQHFLLEKSRVKDQNKGDRNYHVFYFLFTGLTSKEKADFGLKSLSSYNYLKKGGDNLKSDKNEEMEFKNLKKSLGELNFEDEEIGEIFKLLAVIIHLGNFIFTPIVIENNDATEVKKCDSFKTAVGLLNVTEDLLFDALTKKNIIVGGQHLKSYLTPEHACSNRDGFATTLYGHIFSFILNKINKIIHNHSSEKKSSIGILDIFGFENFNNNSFEQLCINFSNEFLQQFFVENVFKIEQVEYQKEGIPWKDLEFTDNQATLEMLSLGKTSVLNLIEEQTKLPQGNDKSFLVKCNQVHMKHPAYIKPRGDLALQFGIKHYAGSVTYNVKGMIEKNRSELSCEWQEVINAGGSDLIKTLFANQAPVRRSAPSLSESYRKSLDGLMKTLSAANPFFIRCLKPNLEKKPMVFDHAFSYRQLQYFGFMATVMIRKAGYPVRYTFNDFVQKYHPLLKDKKLKSGPTPKDTTLIICKSFLKDTDYRLGKTKIFLKDHHDIALESVKNRHYTVSATVIQKNWRRMRNERRLQERKKAALVIQKNWRMRQHRKQFLKMRNAIMRLQSKIRSRRQAYIFSSIRYKIIHLQAHCRGYLIRGAMKEKEKRKALNKMPVEKSSAEIDNWITGIFEEAIDRKVPIENQSKPINAVKRDLDNKYLKERQCSIDDDTLSFSKFAASYFIGNVGYKFTNKPLEQPLLFHMAIGDCWAASVLWVTILRFMGDIPEPNETSKTKTLNSIMRSLYSTLPKSYINSKEYQLALKALEKEEMNRKTVELEQGRQKLMNLTLLHKSKLQSEVRRGQMEGNALRASYDEWLLTKKTTPLEKVHFIIGHGILRPDLRDEIYCQLMKQVTNNPDAGSELRGWILLSLCASCFPPSERLAPTLRRFFSRNENRLKTLSRLLRTLDNGTRLQPPTTIELEAVKKKTEILLEINLLDDSVLRIQADPATTSQEICTLVAEHLGISDRFGFSLFLIIMGEELSLEAGGYHVMDGISQCEEFAKEKGFEESTSPWLLVFRKEMFSPWQFLAPKEDQASASLVYHQVLKGLRAGQYRASSDAELATVVAEHYYLNYRMKMFSDIITNILHEIIPGPILKKNPLNYWIQLVKDKLNKNYFIREKLPENYVKQNLALYCKNKWPLLFSKFYDATQVGGVSLGPTSILLAVNSDGIYFAKNSAEVLLKIPYVEILSCSRRESKKEGTPQISICTIYRTQFVFQTYYADTIVSLVTLIISNLRKMSKYAVAIEHFKPPDESFLELRKGELVILYEPTRDKDWLRGKKLDGEWGEFPVKSVRLLPILKRPDKQQLDAYVVSVENSIDENSPNSYVLNLKKHTLENYFSKYSASWKGKEAKGCRHSKTLLNTAIHTELNGTKNSLEAISMFSSILHFMGDKQSNNKALTLNSLFEKPLNNELLRDEFFCQIVKQLTDNPRKESEDIGWQLLWLASGLFSCSNRLYLDLSDFLLTRPSVLTHDIHSRLGKSSEYGSRKKLCHMMELEAAETQHSMEIDINFPNGAEKTFSINSSTRGRDLVEDVSEWLGIKLMQGFSFAVKYSEEVSFLPNQDFIMDSIQGAVQSFVGFYNLNKDQEDKLKAKPKLYFLKHVWIYTIPGSDERADSTCHYHQELNKYLAGMYLCNLQEVIELAAIIMLAEGSNFDSEMKQNVINNLSSYVPINVLDKLEIRDWILKIGAIHKKCQAFSRKRAKEFFLKFLYKLELFGSAFFNIKEIKNGQKTDIRLAINTNGIYIINTTDLRTLKRIVYSEIRNCTFSNNTFILKLINEATYTWETRCMPSAIYGIINSYFLEK